MSVERAWSETVPFTVVTMSTNGVDCAAVCGTKDCHLFVYNSAGTLAYKLVLDTRLTGNDCIVNVTFRTFRCYAFIELAFSSSGTTAQDNKNNSADALSLAATFLSANF